VKPFIVGAMVRDKFAGQAGGREPNGPATEILADRERDCVSGIASGLTAPTLEHRQLSHCIEW
jgi:hypothetical protein